MPKQSSITSIKAIKMPAKSNNNCAGDWLSRVDIVMDIDIEELESREIFYCSENKEQFYQDGFDLHEYLPIEDLFPTEYRKVVNG